MVARVLPTVRLAFTCDDAVQRTDGKWVVTNPRADILIPSGVALPVNVKEIWVYVQLTEGVGEFDLAPELRYVEVDDTRSVIGRGKATRLAFPAGSQLQVLGTAFRITRIPFTKQGVYEFAVVSTTDEDSTEYVPVPGQTALFRVLTEGAE